MKALEQTLSKASITLGHDHAKIAHLVQRRFSEKFHLIDFIPCHAA